MLCWPFELAQLNKGLFFWEGQIAELGPMNGTAGGRKGKQKRENIGCPEPGDWGVQFWSQRASWPHARCDLCSLLGSACLGNFQCNPEKEAAGRQGIAGWMHSMGCWDTNLTLAKPACR